MPRRTRTLRHHVYALGLNAGVRSLFACLGLANRLLVRHRDPPRAPAPRNLPASASAPDPLAA